jgi:cyclase
MQGKTVAPGRRRHALLKPSILLEIASIRGQLANFSRCSGTHALTFTIPPSNLLKVKTNMRNLWIPVVPLILFCGMAATQDQDFSKVQMKVTKVSGNVYMLEGAGGNIGASVGEDGIVIVDDQYAPMADKIKAALKGITDKPVRFVINTHYHGDHTGGNAIFQQTAPIIAQDNVRKRLQEGGTAGNLGGVHVEAKSQPKEALPIITFDHDVTVHLNGEDIRALHFPSGHTDGDSVIFFPKSNVVHMGDDFVTYGFPFVDLSGGGSVEGMIAALEQVVRQLPPDVKVIPGHGPLSNLDDVRRFTAMLKDTQAVVDKGIKQGKSLDQLKQENVLAPWQKWSGEFITSEQWLVTLYNDLTGKKTGEFIKHN